MYYYFVSYSFSGSTNCSFGFGCCEIERKVPITQISHIQEIVNELAKQNPEFKDFTVLGYQLLREKNDTKKRHKKH